MLARSEILCLKYRTYGTNTESLRGTCFKYILDIQILIYKEQSS